MIKKILITILLVFLIPNNSFAKAPPLGTGSLIPANIMIMLDNSGSMAWDLGGSQLSSDSFLNLPTDIETDSAGNVYVLQQGFTYNSDTRKHYRMHVFNADGEQVGTQETTGIFSDIKTGINLFPLWTASVCPTKIGEIVDLRDHVFITSFLLEAFNLLIFFSSLKST